MLHRGRGLWLLGQEPLFSHLAPVPPSKRSLLPGGQEIPAGQALSSAFSLHFPIASAEPSGFKLPPDFVSPRGEPAERNGCTVPPTVPASSSSWTAPRPTSFSSHRPGWWLELGQGCCGSPWAGSLRPSSAEGCCAQDAGRAVEEWPQVCTSVQVMGKPTTSVNPSAQEILEIWPCAMAG